MNNNRINEIKSEDKKAFKGFTVIIIICLIAGGILGSLSTNLKELLGERIPSLLINNLNGLPHLQVLCFFY